MAESGSPGQPHDWMILNEEAHMIYPGFTSARLQVSASEWQLLVFSSESDILIGSGS